MRWDRYAGRDVIALWVADSDFRAPPAVRAALHSRVEHGVLGYTAAPEELREAIVEYLARRHAWRVEPSWIVFLPGVVPGLHVSARRLLQADEHALIPTPVYHHFKYAVELAPRPHSQVPLVLDRGRWVWDLDALRAARNDRTRVLYLCNPHNPGGTVFTRAELLRLAELAAGCVIVSDEIHCDLVLDEGARHVPIASLSPEISRRTVTLMSANKAFNFPAAGCAWAVVEDAALREAMSADVKAHFLPSPSVFGYEATLAALHGADAWLAAQLSYLRGNRDLVEAELPLPMAHVEATYLAWIDSRSVPDAHAWFLKNGVALSPGEQFGAPGFVRLNFGTQRERLRQALQRMRRALSSAG
ncbi:MAG TPA: PatB family C-S lyase [Burkholderiales bacterium]|nr:PatB family C-S lyase [Burkholderiales bacterium]